MSWEVFGSWATVGAAWIGALSGLGSFFHQWQKDRRNKPDLRTEVTPEPQWHDHRYLHQPGHSFVVIHPGPQLLFKFGIRVINIGRIATQLSRPFATDENGERLDPGVTISSADHWIKPNGYIDLSVEVGAEDPSKIPKEVVVAIECMHSMRPIKTVRVSTDIPGKPV